MAGQRFRARFSTWMLRPYLDLGPFVAGPLHARALEECWHAFVYPRVAPFTPQRAMAPGFRAQLAVEAGGPPYDLIDPRQLPEALRTERWEELCGAIQNWNELPVERRCRLACLLHALGLYQLLLELVPEPGNHVWGDVAHEVELAYWRASARYMREIPRRMSDYDEADMDSFCAMALHAHDHAEARFNATALVFVHKAKTGAPVQELAPWADGLERALGDVLRGVDAFTAELLTSRYYRAMGFLPQRGGNRAEVARLMDLAERHARALIPSSGAQEHLQRENLHAVLESRAKEARWVGDQEAALARSLEVTTVDPHDSKAWVELGQVHFFRQEWREAAGAYAVAATLGPPASAVGRYMTGVCLQKCGDDFLGALHFKDTIEIDPFGISSREAIHRLPNAAAFDALRQWARSTASL